MFKDAKEWYNTLKPWQKVLVVVVIGGGLVFIAVGIIAVAVR